MPLQHPSRASLVAQTPLRLPGLVSNRTIPIEIISEMQDEMNLVRSVDSPTVIKLCLQDEASQSGQVCVFCK
jgi:hypothetical protein